MCTILLRWDPAASEPIVVGANRDEFRERLADDPAAIAPGVYAGRDRRAGGTWLAVGARRLAAVTNISGVPPAPDRRSRGELPLLAVAGTLPSSFAAWNAFNLLVIDEAGVRVIVHRGDGVASHVVELRPGAYAIVNEPFGEERSGRVERARRLVTAAVPDMAMLAEHGGEGDGLCHHGPAYGTVSATVIALDAERRVVRYVHADGLPCRARAVDHTAAARAVIGAALP